MPRPPDLRVSLRGVTPLFIGGGKLEPNPQQPDELSTPAELRPPSIKGLLRFWYRAVAGTNRDREDALFGSTRTGQSPCLLRVGTWMQGAAPWDDQRYRKLPAQGGFRQGAGREAENGIIYLGYSLKLGDNDRRALPPEKSGFRLFVTPHPQRGRSSEVHRAWLAALWLLVHIGGVGSRSRRGLGSLRIDRWEGWEECESLPLACRASTPEEWKARMEAGLDTLRAWFPEVPAVDHTVVTPRMRFHLLREGHGTWEQAVDDAGRRLQRFRRRRSPDYQGVKEHLARRYADRVAPTPGLTPRYLTEGPVKAGFGLPLSFRYASLHAPEITFVGAEHGRMASPLFIRILHLGERYHAAFAHLPAPLLPDGEGLKERGGPRSWPWPREAATIVEEFLTGQAAATVEVRGR